MITQITRSDVSKVFGDRLAASPEFAAAVPGRAWADQGPDVPDAYPYGVFKVEKVGGPEINSDQTYTQEFAVTLAVYAPMATTVTDPQSIELAIAAAVNGNPTNWAALRSGSVLHSIPQGFDGKYADRLRQGQNVFVVGETWHLLCSGTF